MACGGILRPAAVFFGDPLDRDVLGRARAVARGCDLFVAAGSSLRVEPAAGLCAVAVQAGATLLVVNRDPTPYDSLAARVIRSPGVGEALPALVGELVGARM